MRFSNHAKVYIESALLKMIHLKGPIQAQTQSNPTINSGVADKITELERIVGELQQQIKAGVSAQPVAGAPAARKNPSKSSQSFRTPTGKINEVLKSATKQDIQTIRENWPGMMQTLQKSHSALLEETEPVAASENAFVLKFKYDIHCLMASENTSLRSGLSDALSSQTGTAYEVIYVPEKGWLSVREDFIKSNNLGKESSEDQFEEAEEMLDFVKEAEVENADPLVQEAENIFGKDFIEVHED